MADAPAPLSADVLRGRPGIDILRDMMRGALPAPPINQLMATRLVEVGVGLAVFEGEPGLEHYNPIGSVHGGYAATLLDSCMGCAVHSALPAGSGYTTIDINITYVRPMTTATGTVTARGEVINAGRRVASARGTLTDAAGKILAHGTSSLLIFPL